LELADMRLDHRPDAMMLEGACIGYQRAVEADLTLAKEGLICVQQTLDPQTQMPIEKLKAHPAVSISKSSWNQVRAFCSEFGLSPVSRTRLALDKEEHETEDLMTLLTQPRNKPKQVVQ